MNLWFCAARSDWTPRSRESSDCQLSLARRIYGFKWMARVVQEEEQHPQNVPKQLVEDWKMRLPEVLAGYNKEDIFNPDETGLFFRKLPNRSLIIKGDECKGGHKSKDRIIALIACPAAGGMLKLLVIAEVDQA